MSIRKRPQLHLQRGISASTPLVPLLKLGILVKVCLKYSRMQEIVKQTEDSKSIGGWSLLSTGASVPVSNFGGSFMTKSIIKDSGFPFKSSVRLLPH